MLHLPRSGVVKNDVPKSDSFSSCILMKTLKQQIILRLIVNISIDVSNSESLTFGFPFGGC